MKKLGIIGGGNMAESLIAGLLSSGQPASSIQVAEPNSGRRNLLSSTYNIESMEDNALLAAQSDILLLAVKPQLMQSITSSLRASILKQQPLIISIAAGITTGNLSHWLGDKLPIVRVMPNTPALVRAGASGLFANKFVTAPQKDAAESILRSVGVTVWLDDESQIDIVTALSGSGPGYIFRIIEAMEDAATKAGLDREMSRLLAIETVLGSAKLALESNDSPAELRARVTSPGGTTEKGLEQLELGKIDKIFENTINAAINRSKELANEAGALK